RAGERVLRVGVDVHLDDAVVHRVADFLLGRTRTTVEDQVERLVLADLLADLVLDLLEQLRTQAHVARLVDAVDVAESQRGHVTTLFTGTERLDRGAGVGNGRVQLVIDRGGDTVFLAADDADLDLQDD